MLACGGVSVFDHALSAAACTHIHTAASLGGLGDEGHTVFDRSIAPRTPLESALHSVLIALRDESPWVEYWWRDEWQHVESHVDIDEYLFEKSGEWRVPHHAHVLYLNVGERVQGPTCVWRPAADGKASANEYAREDFGPLTVVPAVAGRLLRFDGSLQHAVPAPVGVWFSGAQGSIAGDRAEYVRSVLLFNTWSEKPRDVPTTPSVEPAEVLAQFSSDFGGPAVDRIVRAMAIDDASANPFADWEPVVAVPAAGVAQPAGGREGSAPQVWLLGEAPRRRQPERTLQLKGTAAAPLMSALVEQSRVTAFD